MAKSHWAHEIVAYLAETGVGMNAKNLFWGFLPDDPASCGAIVPYPGEPPEKQFGTEEIWLEKPRAQFTWRGPTPDDAETAFLNAQVAFEALARIQTQTILDFPTFYHVVEPLQAPYLRDLEVSGLPLVSFNFRVVRDLTTRGQIGFSEGFSEGFR